MRAVRTDAAPAPIGPYSQAVAVGDLLFCSGMIGLVPATGQLASEDVAGQTSQVLTNIAGLLASEGLTWAHVVKTTIFLADLNDFATVNALYAAQLAEPYPARSTVEVSRLPRDCRVEIEVIARRQAL
jgi:2-iminobutanoate/2-iminopropanoate deaminase